MDAKLNISQQSALASNKASSILGCIRRVFASRLKEMIFPLSSVLVRAPLKHHVQFWDIQYKREMHILKKWGH